MATRMDGPRSATDGGAGDPEGDTRPQQSGTAALSTPVPAPTYETGITIHHASHGQRTTEKGGDTTVRITALKQHQREDPSADAGP